MEVFYTISGIAVLIFIGRFIERTIQRFDVSAKQRHEGLRLSASLKPHTWDGARDPQAVARSIPVTAWERRNVGGLSDSPLSDEDEADLQDTSADPSQVVRQQTGTPQISTESIKYLDLLDDRERLDMEKAAEYESQLSFVDEIFEGKIFGVTIMLDGERKAYNAARKAISALRLRNWQVHAQVAMGEFIETGYRNAKYTFNSKRVDLLICDKEGMPRLVVEHQGDGHIRKLRNASGETFESKSDTRRNAVKKRVLERAGIPLVETQDDDSAEAAFKKIEQALSEISAAGIDVRRKSVDFDE